LPPSLTCSVAGCDLSADYRLATARDAAESCGIHLELAVRELSRDFRGGVSVWPVYDLEELDATRPFPPLRETARRRPPAVPAKPITELSGADLVRALYDELGAELADLQDDEYATSSAPCDRRPGCLLTAGGRGSCPCGSVL
jgi:hypothetical protein